MNFYLDLISFVNSRNMFRLRLSYDCEQQGTIQWPNDFKSFVCRSQKYKLGNCKRGENWYV